VPEAWRTPIGEHSDRFITNHQLVPASEYVRPSQGICKSGSGPLSRTRPRACVNASQLDIPAAQDLLCVYEVGGATSRNYIS
jgi:hypothetical protein